MATNYTLLPVQVDAVYSLHFVHRLLMLFNAVANGDY
jgi:hypothetical protein